MVKFSGMKRLFGGLVGAILFLECHCFCADRVTSQVLYLQLTGSGGLTNLFYELRDFDTGRIEIKSSHFRNEKETNIAALRWTISEAALRIQREFAKSPKVFRHDGRSDPVFTNGLPVWCFEARYVDGDVIQKHSITANTVELWNFVDVSPDSRELIETLVSKGDKRERTYLLPPK